VQQAHLFEYENYREFVRDYIKTLPRSGHGQFRQLADVLRTTTVTISQIFSGKLNLSTDQALELCLHFGFKDIEIKYFVSLVQMNNSSHYRAKAFFKAELESIRKETENIEKVIPKAKRIDEKVAIQFYSDWIYSAVRLLTSIEKHQTLNGISEYLKLPKPRIREILDFLIENGLVVEDQKGNLQHNVASTHLPASSPWVKARQISWRIKATEFMDSKQYPENIFYTGPCSIDRKNFDGFRKELIRLIEKFVKLAEASTPTDLACLNIDWFFLR